MSRRIPTLLRLPGAIAVCAGAAVGIGWVAGPALPVEVPSPSTLAEWEKVDGDVETAESIVSYRFYVNPRRPGLYELTQYRMTRIVPGIDGSRERRRETEKVLWNARPDLKQPIVCYELRDGSWRKLQHGSAEYIAEMHTAIQVYSIHRTVVNNRR